jgi:hypothetical protein
MGDPAFPTYFRVATWLVGAIALAAIASAVAAALGKRRFLGPAIALDAALFLAGLLSLGWGTVHGLHGLYLPRHAETMEALLGGVAPGINTFNAALFGNVVATLILALALWRRGPAQ